MDWMKRKIQQPWFQTFSSRSRIFLTNSLFWTFFKRFLIFWRKNEFFLLFSRWFPSCHGANKFQLIYNFSSKAGLALIILLLTSSQRNRWFNGRTSREISPSFLQFDNRQIRLRHRRRYFKNDSKRKMAVIIARLMSIGPMASAAPRLRLIPRHRSPVERSVRYHFGPISQVRKSIFNFFNRNYKSD